MGLYLDYPVPAHVKEAIDRLSMNELWDLVFMLKIPEDDTPEDDHYDWVRERIYDFLYKPKA